MDLWEYVEAVEDHKETLERRIAVDREAQIGHFSDGVSAAQNLVQCVIRLIGDREGLLTIQKVVDSSFKYALTRSAQKATRTQVPIPTSSVTTEATG